MKKRSARGESPRRPGPAGPRGPDRAPAARPEIHPTAAAEAGEIVYGFRAALAVHEVRPGDVQKVAFARERRADVEGLAEACSARGISCEEKSEDELARIAGSTHHEGLVLRARPRKWSSLQDLADTLIRTRGYAIALDRVRNPYNVGAILRSAAFFGIEGAILGAIAPHPALAPDAVRVAEGGAEHVRLARTTDLAETLVRLRGRGLRVVGAESDTSASVFGHAFAPPTILVLGHEREGLSPKVRAACDALVTIPGGGAIESLNVAVAASLCIAELARSRPARR
jgi:TrmH RNA methyltransferase